MQERSFEEWFRALPGEAQDRCRRMVAELDASGQDSRVRQRVRADMEQRHAPLAFETFVECVHPGEWTVAARYQVEELLGRDTLAWQERYGPHIQPARHAVDRIIANGGSHEDLAAFAFLVAAAKVQDVGFTLSHGEFFADLPGWRLMETWHGELTGRPLSIWGVYQAQSDQGARATARDGSRLEAGGALDDRLRRLPDAGSAAGEAKARAADPTPDDQPLIGPVFWDMVRRARLEQLEAREIARRGIHQPPSKVRRSELGEMVMTLIATVRQALEQEGDRAPNEGGTSEPLEAGSRQMDEEAFEKLMAVPLQRIVGFLSGTTANPGSSPLAGHRPW